MAQQRAPTDRFASAEGKTAAELDRKFFVDGWTIAWKNGADIAPRAVGDAALAFYLVSTPF